MKEKKRFYLTKKQQSEIAKSFLESLTEATFGYDELAKFLEDFDWFKSVGSRSFRNRRQNQLISVMKNQFSVIEIDDKKWVPGTKKLFKILDKDKIVSEEPVPMKKSTKRLDVESLRKFYLVIKAAKESMVGISRKDVHQITGQDLSLDELNNIFEGETGFRPLIEETKRFLRISVYKADPEIVNLVLDDLKERIGEEPILPVFESYESKVKSIIRRDYYMLSMFKKDNTILYKDVRFKSFKEYVVGHATKSASLVANEYSEILKKRYDIDLKVIGVPKRHITIADTGGNPLIREALTKIESIFAEYFCEDIVDPERTVWQEDVKRETSPTKQEDSLLRIIETTIFKEQSGGLFLSELWNKLKEVRVENGWNILALLKKVPERFKIEKRSNPGGILEDFIKYTAPEKVVEVPVEIEQGQESAEEPKPAETKVEEVKQQENVVEIYVGFSNREDVVKYVRSNPETVCKYHEDYIYKVKVDRADKRSILEYLKLYYMSINNPDITVILENSIEFAEELEEMLLN